MGYPKVYEKTLTINSRDVDGAGQCKYSALLGYLQDAAAEHSLCCQCDRKSLMERYHVFWMLTRIQVRLRRPICWLEALTIRTGHRGGKGVLFYRDYELWSGGEEIGAACALWVLPDLDTHKLLDLSATQIPELALSSGGLAPQIQRLNALHGRAGMIWVEERPIRYSDTDVNGHMNNSRYADLACDALSLERRPAGSFVSQMEITYHEECRPGEVVSIFKASAGEAWSIHGEGADGASKFDIRIQIDAESTGSDLC